MEEKKWGDDDDDDDDVDELFKYNIYNIINKNQYLTCVIDTNKKPRIFDFDRGTVNFDVKLDNFTISKSKPVESSELDLPVFFDILMEKMNLITNKDVHINEELDNISQKCKLNNYINIPTNLIDIDYDTYIYVLTEIIRLIDIYKVQPEININTEIMQSPIFTSKKISDLDYINPEYYVDKLIKNNYWKNIYHIDINNIENFDFAKQKQAIYDVLYNIIKKHIPKIYVFEMVLTS